MTELLMFEVHVKNMTKGRGEGEKGRRGEGEKGRRGEGEKGRRGEGEKGRRRSRRGQARVWGSDYARLFPLMFQPECQN